MGSLGVPEMILLFILALVLFGPKKLPEIGRTLGKAITEFRKASTDLKATFEREMQTLEQETRSIKEAANDYQYDTYNYDYSSYDQPGQEGSDQEVIGEGSDSTAASPSTESASAPQGAELPSAEAPEGVIAYGSETNAESLPLEGSGPSEEREPDGSEAVSSPAEQKA